MLGVGTHIMVGSYSGRPCQRNFNIFLINSPILQQPSRERHTPTRPASLKTGDLVLSSFPSLVSFVRVIPGMRDHDIVFFNIRSKYNRTSRLPLKVYQYDKADFDKLRQDVSKGASEFFTRCAHSHLEVNWSFFKTLLTVAVDKRVPLKNVKFKNFAPQDQRIKGTAVLRKARRTGDKRSPEWLEYRCQRNRVVELLKTAHNDCLNNVIRGSLEENPKRFWSYNKCLRSEDFCIPMLLCCFVYLQKNG